MVNKLSSPTQTLFYTALPCTKRFAKQHNLSENWAMQAAWNQTRIVIEELILKNGMVKTDKPNHFFTAIPVSGIDDDVVKVILDYANMKHLDYIN